MIMNRNAKVTVITEADVAGGVDARQAPPSEPISDLVDNDAVEVLVLDTQRPIGQLVTTLLRAWHGDEERSHNVISALLPPTVPSAAATEQLRRNAEARSSFLAEFAALSTTELADAAGITWSNRAAWASRLQKEGKVFSVEYGRRQLFPTFQFTRDWQPRDAVAMVVEQLQAAGLQGWSVALWWTAANGWLES